MLKRPIIGSLRIIGKTTGRQFPAIEMITDAITTIPFAGTRFITAITRFQILLMLAFHQDLPVENPLKIHRLHESIYS
jgi:hypothetical protein